MKSLIDTIKEGLNINLRIPADYSNQYYMALFIERFVNDIQLKWQQRRGNGIIAYLKVKDFANLIDAIKEDKPITIKCNMGASIRQYKKATLEYKSGLIKYEVEPKDRWGEMIVAKWPTDSIMEHINEIENIINSL